jgi:hypothetical protein
MFMAGQAKRFQAGQAGHAHVGNHHVDFLLAQNFQRPFARRNRNRFKALAAQEGIQEAALASVVIDDEKARG